MVDTMVPNSLPTFRSRMPPSSPDLSLVKTSTWLPSASTMAGLTQRSKKRRISNSVTTTRTSSSSTTPSVPASSAPTTNNVSLLSRSAQKREATPTARMRIVSATIRSRDRSVVRATGTSMTFASRRMIPTHLRHIRPISPIPML
jgi:hypothetical protein